MKLWFIIFALKAIGKVSGNVSSSSLDNAFVAFDDFKKCFGERNSDDLISL